MTTQYGAMWACKWVDGSKSMWAEVSVWVDKWASDWVIMYIPHPLSDENSWFCWWTSDTPVNIVSIYIKREREGLNPMTCPFMFFQVPSFSLIHSLTCTLNHLLTYPLTHSPQLTYSLTHPLICKLTWHHTVWSLTIFMLNCHYVAFLNGCMPL